MCLPFTRRCFLHVDLQISHTLDKPFESLCGYLQVLPGAFSTYRWAAIRGEPLAAYFTIEETPIASLGPAMANCYLAEDRILSLHTVSKLHRRWLLRYVQGSVADTDAPLTLVELLKQVSLRWCSA